MTPHLKHVLNLLQFTGCLFGGQTKWQNCNKDLQAWQRDQIYYNILYLHDLRQDKINNTCTSSNNRNLLYRENLKKKLNMIGLKNWKDISIMELDLSKK